MTIKSGIYLFLLSLIMSAIGWNLFLKSKVPEPIYDHIIFITIDTLRADHMGSYGYPRNTTPFLDSLAQKGVLFQKAISAMSTTLPSHISMFTSLYPVQHKVFNNGEILDDTFYTMAEYFKENGYQTAAIVSTDRHFKSGGLSQGFAYFNEPILNEGEKYRNAEATINQTLSFLQRVDSDKKLFLWVHLFDPHIPYEKRDSYIEQVTQNFNGVNFYDFLTNEHHIDPSTYDSVSDMIEYINLYDSEISFVDFQLKRFNAYLTDMKFNQNALWVITSDHGEGLGNHGWLEHSKNIYNEQLHVPLIIYTPQNVFSPNQIKHQVESIDIFPTLSDMIHQPLHLKVPTLSGNSFAKDLTKKWFHWNRKKWALSQRRSFDISSIDMKKYAPGSAYAIQNYEFKYILNTEDQDELYDLRRDPHELQNLLLEQHSLTEVDPNFILNWVNQLETSNEIKSKKVDQDTINKLKSLGYIQ